MDQYELESVISIRKSHLRKYLGDALDIANYGEAEDYRVRISELDNVLEMIKGLEPK